MADPLKVIRPYDEENPRRLLFVTGARVPNGDEPNFSSAWWEWRRNQLEQNAVRMSEMLYEQTQKRRREKLAAARGGSLIEQTAADRTIALVIME
jgi:hypothetical protein